MQVSLLDGRLEISIRVDQMSVQATNLRTPQETRFGQDCALLAHAFMEKIAPQGALAMPPNAAALFSPSTWWPAMEGVANLQIASWLKVDVGKDGIAKILARAAPSQRSSLDPTRPGAERVDHFPRMTFQNSAAGWQLLFAAEPAAIPDANLYLHRNYCFRPGGEFDTRKTGSGFRRCRGMPSANGSGSDR